MRVLSLFDGISCGRLALERAGIHVDQYYASEIEESSISVSKRHYPYDTHIHVGDVSRISHERVLQSDTPVNYHPQVATALSETPVAAITERVFLPGKFDLLIGGSPCQSFSAIGDGSGFDGKSGLFWQYVRLLNEVQPTYFLLENVKMRRDWQDVITEALGVEPILIDSAHVSAQRRKRLYWTNIPGVGQPEDKGICLRDIIQSERVAPQFFLSEKAKGYMGRAPAGFAGGKVRWESYSNPLSGKAMTLTANMGKGVPYGVVEELGRRLTPLECERLQTLPDGWTDGIPTTSRYQMIGNGWTVDVIAHILGNIPQRLS